MREIFFPKDASGASFSLLVQGFFWSFVAVDRVRQCAPPSHSLRRLHLEPPDQRARLWDTRVQPLWWSVAQH